MSLSKSSRPGAAVLCVSALVGLVISLYAYFAPLTGVNGTLGALLAIVVSAVIALMAIVLMGMHAGAGRVVWRVLIVVALAGNCFAGVLLHEWWLCVAMVIGLVGLVISLFTRTAGSARANGSASS